MNSVFFNEWNVEEKNWFKKVFKKWSYPIVMEIIRSENLIKETDRKVEETERRLEETERRLEENELAIRGIEVRLEKDNSKIDNNTQRINCVEGGLQSVFNKLGSNTERIDASERKITGNIELTDKNLDAIYAIKKRLDIIFDKNNENKLKICSVEQKLDNWENVQQGKWNGLLDRNASYEEEQQQKLAAIARELTKTHWGLIDFIDKINDKDDLEAICPICEYEGKIDSLEKRETDCIFGGGHLVRYICPECGGIFGPLKFSRQIKEERADDYVINYIGYREADSTDGEMATFQMLQPKFEGIYLNYGCGVWAETIEKLNYQGYKVYGYEPYASDIDNPYIIKDIEQLKKMRFDGIFSHDLLEHLENPVEELKFMKSLLRNSSAKMAHSTACYEYKYEYTRFHTFFYTGEAVQYLCEKSGLLIEDYKDDGGNKDFICYVFGVKEEMIDIYKYMYSTESGKALLEAKGTDGIIFGPYFDLRADNYKLSLDIDFCDTMTETEMLVTAESGRKVISHCLILEGESVQEIKLENNEREVEFVFRTFNNQKVILNSIGFI